MKIENFINIINSDFYTGVPDSQLKALCDYLYTTYGINSHHHIIAANEGNAAALAAGYYLATGKIPVVYMQNSGEGNIINPAVSLLNEKVYAIPVIFIIGWRGEPGVHDEPQHIYQGTITCELLETLNMKYKILSSETTNSDIESTMKDFQTELADGHSVAFVIKKGAFSYDKKVVYQNQNTLRREEVIEYITKISGDDLVISTTGKASRELFEIRERGNVSHATDFLTVGSMGHCSSIALGVALNTNKKTWCIDGDGAALMHMGSLPVIAFHHPKNLIHIVINNGAHETVGGQPTVAGKLNFAKIAQDCGYPYCASVSTLKELTQQLEYVKTHNDLSFIEIKCNIGARTDLGRPTISSLENKNHFMSYIKSESCTN